MVVTWFEAFFGAVVLWATYQAGRRSTQWKPLTPKEIKDPDSGWGD